MVKPEDRREGDIPPLSGGDACSRIASEILIFIILWMLPTAAAGFGWFTTVYSVLGILVLTGWISHAIYDK